MYNDIGDSIEFVTQFDPEVGNAMNDELKRQRRNLEPVSYTHLDVYKRQG